MYSCLARVLRRGYATNAHASGVLPRPVLGLRCMRRTGSLDRLPRVQLQRFMPLPLRYSGESILILVVYNRLGWSPVSGCLEAPCGRLVCV